MLRFFFCGDRLGKTNLVVSDRKGPATIKVIIFYVFYWDKATLANLFCIVNFFQISYLKLFGLGLWKLGMGLWKLGVGLKTFKWALELGMGL